MSNSRPQKRLNQVWRRRVCRECQGIFSTLEGVDWEHSLAVRSGKVLQPFSRDKLFITIYEACRHRKDATEAATALTATAMSQLLPRMHTAMLQRNDIIEVTTKILGHFDKAAVVHYTAYHPPTA